MHKLLRLLGMRLQLQKLLLHVRLLLLLWRPAHPMRAHLLLLHLSLHLLLLLLLLLLSLHLLLLLLPLHLLLLSLRLLLLLL